MSDAAAIRTLWPRHAPKLLARLMGVPVGTAHEWLYRRLPAARLPQIADALIAECDRALSDIAETRRYFTEVRNEARGSVVGRAADPGRAAPVASGPAARPVGRAIGG